MEPNYLKGSPGAFSFYPSKNLGAGGDGGCLITRSREVADRIRSLANHGRSGRYHHTEIGWNERLDALQAAILAVKLRHLEGWTAARRRAATRYSELLAGISPWGEPLRLPRHLPGADPVHHLYVVRHPRRDEIAAALGNEGIGTATHYTVTLPAVGSLAGFEFGNEICAAHNHTGVTNARWAEDATMLSGIINATFRAAGLPPLPARSSG